MVSFNLSSPPPLLIDLPRNPILAVGIPLGLGLGTGLLTRKSKYGPGSLYEQSLTKPAGYPPRQAFGIVWPILYAAMGWSSHLIVKTLDKTPRGLGRQQVLRSLSLYWIQLGLNQIWTPLNFGAAQFGLATLDITSLAVTLAYWLNDLKDVNKQAFWLNVPYLAWTGYATYLCGANWWLNGGKDSVSRGLAVVKSLLIKGRKD